MILPVVCLLPSCLKGVDYSPHVYRCVVERAIAFESSALTAMYLPNLLIHLRLQLRKLRRRRIRDQYFAFLRSQRIKQPFLSRLHSQRLIPADDMHDHWIRRIRLQSRRRQRPGRNANYTAQSHRRRDNDCFQHGQAPIKLHPLQRDAGRWSIDNRPDILIGTRGAVAQLGEHRVCNAGVGGSSPLGSIFVRKPYRFGSRRLLGLSHSFKAIFARFHVKYS